ncbi:hypothetical protein ACIBG8_26055 [Nonomuraea sp. NPDC050556]|uniref:hypothetical protein n=1 Tax=Nonomuraea sp. NPDC050556 TaxID=3364369 RepID=UPI0037932921
MHPETPRPTRRWVRLLASLAVAAASLTATVAVVSAAPASACCIQPRHPDEEGYRVIPRDGFGNYDYVYDSGRVREYRDFRFYREYYR